MPFKILIIIDAALEIFIWTVSKLRENLYFAAAPAATAIFDNLLSLFRARFISPMGCPESVNNQTIKFTGIVGRITRARSSCAQARVEKSRRWGRGGLGGKKNRGRIKYRSIRYTGAILPSNSKLF